MNIIFLFQVSPLKRRRNGEIIMRHLALRDSTSENTVTLAVFGNDAEGDYSVGDCVEVTDVYSWTSPKKKKTLGMKKSSKLQVIF